MQQKISSFFKSPSPPASSPPKSPDPPPEIDDLFGPEDPFAKQPEIHITYQRRTPNPDSGSIPKTPNLVDLLTKQAPAAASGKILNKKRSYAQFHLELGQSNFLLKTCSSCGFKYAAGDEGDEEFHKTFHKNYTHGVQFKGWRNERNVELPSLQRKGRVVLVPEDAPGHQKNKVQEVVKMMEMELGDGWIFHEHCKVYLFVESQRVAGCLVTEPIKEAYKVISSSVVTKREGTSTKKPKPNSTVLQFGELTFHRERVRRVSSVINSNTLEANSYGAIYIEEEAIPARCGIRAIWVSPSNRRKQIATHLLDAARISFCTGDVLKRSELAFSQPTSAGKALASNYASTSSFLVYKTGVFDTSGGRAPAS